MSHPSQRLELTWFNKDQALIPQSRGKYGYAWVDPKDPRYCEVHSLVETDRVEGVQAEKVDGTVYSERADLTPQTDNLLIHGESGDVLEALHYVPELATQYVGKVKLCYIDPPFNTEKTFEHYDDALEHSVWLTMMRDRLQHIRDLLTADGSIWVHLDDHENHRMRCLLDEVFGAQNFVAEIAWEKAQGARNDTDISTAHDTITVYKSAGTDDFKDVRNLLARSAVQLARYQNPDNDPRGPWRQGDNGTAKSGGPDSRFPIELPSGRVVTPPPGSYWRFSESTFDTAREENRVWFGSDGDSLPVIKRYLVNVQDGVVPRTWWPADEVGSNQEAKRDHLRKMFPDEEPFGTPKPERLLERIIHIASNPGDIVLDVFAGSGTTAAVAQKMGRRWVTCELREDNFTTFTRPRLEKVVQGEDPRGVTVTKGERIDDTEDELPEGLSPDDAAKFNSLLDKATDGMNLNIEVVKVVASMVRRRVKAGETQLSADESKSLVALLRKFGNDKAGGSADVLAAAKKDLKARTKTRESGDVVNWRGGGGFRVMELSPDVFGYNEKLGVVTLTDAAHGDTLVTSVAANLGFALTPGEHPFHGRKGAMRLVVVDGTLTTDGVDDVLAHLPEGERVTIAATGVLDGVRSHLRGKSRGSVVKHVPDDLFPFSAASTDTDGEG
ncbi:site-specific DNA-methyltransferase [Dietzia cinnamea]|uniref:site-specific DNA-methyltransferase n=1 Tax=Dietzia cinnamea TaxID=321318 RepID=UPI00077332F9|nr:site-specific DNA-methyltransferase [Dietzia cinnamea]